MCCPGDHGHDSFRDAADAFAGGGSHGFGGGGSGDDGDDNRPPSHWQGHVPHAKVVQRGRKKSVIISGSSPLLAAQKQSSGRRPTVRAQDLKSHGNVVKQAAADPEAGKQKGDVDFVESSIENAKNHHVNVEHVTRIIEKMHVEMHDYEDRIFFLEHIQLAKMILKIIVDREKAAYIKAWRTWAGSCNLFGGQSRENQIVILGEQVDVAKAAYDDAEAVLDARLKKLADVALKALDTKKRSFLVSIFSKNGPEMKNGGFLRWKLTVKLMVTQEKTWTAFFAKVENMQLNMGWQKWKTCFYEEQMPPEQIIRALQERVEKQRAETGRYEAELEKICLAQTKHLFDNLGDDKRRKLTMTLTKMFKRQCLLALKAWNEKAMKGHHWRTKQIKVLNMMLKAYLSMGWKTWAKYAQLHKRCQADKEAQHTQTHIKLLYGQVDALNALLRKQQVEVEAMRDSVELQSKAAMRVAAARQAILGDFDAAYDIATQDVTQQLPPLDLSVSVS